jgi:hypothetical protein
MGIFCKYCQKPIHGYELDGFVVVEQRTNGNNFIYSARPFHIECWKELAGQWFLPVKIKEDYLCRICNKPIHAGHSLIQIGNNKDSVFEKGPHVQSTYVCHPECFDECAGEMFWKT